MAVRNRPMMRRGGTMSYQTSGDVCGGRVGRLTDARKFAIRIILITLIMLSALYFCLKSKFGSFDDAVSAIAGDGLRVPEPVIRLGEIDPGGTYDVRFRIVNHSDRPFRVVGSDSSCSCSAVGRLPKKIPPRVDDAIEIRFNPTSDEAQALHINLYTDDPRHPKIPLTITAGGPTSLPAGD